MKVHELRTVLDHLPDDLDVHVQTWGRWGSGSCCQVGTVRRRNRDRSRGIEPSVVLSGRVPWNEPEVAFRLDGSFRHGADLIVKLLLGPPTKRREQKQ